MNSAVANFADVKIDRNRDVFLRELLRDLAGVLEDAVGLEEAESFLCMVGSRMGEQVNKEYCAAVGSDRLDIGQVAAALVDLKARIEGGFSVESLHEDRIVLVNTACPFGEMVLGRPSLCMMTSNVFGRVAADNLGYARVELHEAIARGDQRCRITIHLAPGRGGREYFG